MLPQRNTETGSNHVLGSIWLCLTRMLHALLISINPPPNTDGRTHDCKPPDHTDESVSEGAPARNGRKTRTKSGVHKRDSEKSDATKEDTSPSGMMASLASGACLKLGVTLLLVLQLKFSDRHNALYRHDDMYRMLLAMCCGGKSATAEGQYRNHKLPDKTRLPSRSWLYKKVGAVRHDHMLIRCRRMVRRTIPKGTACCDIP